MAETFQIDKKKIFKNTLLLYIRMLILMLTGLFTVRVLLNALGTEDYGVYNAIAGVVTLLSFMNASMASATQRYFSFALGKKDRELLQRIFGTNLLIYVLIAAGAVILLETIGLWFLNQKLVLPTDRLYEANIVYQFAVLTLVFQIFTSPLIAIIIAHEDMHYYTYISGLDIIFKLAAALSVFLFPANKMMYYALLNMIVCCFSLLIYICVCYKKYPACQFGVGKYDKSLLKEIFGFTGWTLFGSMTCVVRGQLVTLLLNQMFNPVVVAAKVIALNVSTVVQSFSNNFNVGLYPPIVKSYAAGAKQEMFQLIYEGCKITFFLMWVFALPLLLRMDYVLTLWLKNPPEGAVLFTQLALIEALIVSVSMPLTTAARAPGKMMLYELVLGSMQIAIFPISWGVLAMGYPPYSVFVVGIAINILMFFVRLIIVSHLTELPFFTFLWKVGLPVMAVLIVSTIPSWFINRFIPEGFFWCGLLGIMTIVFTCGSMFCLGLNKQQKIKFISIIKSNLIRRTCP